MNKILTSLAIALAVLLGVALGRASVPATALAQMPMQSQMPMHSQMMACPHMQQMMHSHSAVDRALMQSMMSMHTGMQSMTFTGDADRDFMAMMIPHHQAAVDMAQVEIQYGKDPKVVELAKGMLAAQRHEIAVMRGWLL